MTDAHAYVIKNYQKYGIVSSAEDMEALLNILESFGECLENLAEAEGMFCGIDSQGRTNAELAAALLECNQFIDDMDAFREQLLADGMTEADADRYTSGFVKVSGGYVNQYIV